VQQLYDVSTTVVCCQGNGCRIAARMTHTCKEINGPLVVRAEQCYVNGNVVACNGVGDQLAVLRGTIAAVAAAVAHDCHRVKGGMIMSGGWWLLSLEGEGNGCVCLGYHSKVRYRDTTYSDLILLLLSRVLTDCTGVPLQISIANNRVSSHRVSSRLRGLLSSSKRPSACFDSRPGAAAGGPGCGGIVPSLNLVPIILTVSRGKERHIANEVRHSLGAPDMGGARGDNNACRLGGQPRIRRIWNLCLFFALLPAVFVYNASAVSSKNSACALPNSQGNFSTTMNAADYSLQWQVVDGYLELLIEVDSDSHINW
jgi:hypothetical protein